MVIYEYFQDSELSCGCNCGKMPDKISVEMLYAVRIMYGSPIRITSGARCKEYNARIGGSKNSKHMIGAFDCKVPKEDELRFMKIAMSVGFNGIGFKDNVFIHLDRHRISDAMWGY